MSSSPTRDWLQVPAISIADDFSRDLLQQLDKCHSQLRTGTPGVEEQRLPSRHSSGPVSFISHRQEQDQHATRHNTFPIHHTGPQGGSPATDTRRHPARELLRRSSAFLRAKLEAFKPSSLRPDSANVGGASGAMQVPSASSDRSQNQRRLLLFATRSSKKKQRRAEAHDTFPSSPSSASLPAPSKIAVNTTICIPHPPRPAPAFNGTTTSSPGITVQPPIITQYPPRPLKYSPVEPLSDEPLTHGNKRTKKLIQRLSLPILNFSSSQQLANDGSGRRRSDSDMLNRTRATRQPPRGAIGRTAWRLSQWVAGRQPKSENEEAQ